MGASPSKIQKDHIFKFLKTRVNFGCHPNLGRAGVLTRLSQVRESNRRVYKVGVAYDNAPPEYTIITPENLQRRGLTLSHPAVQVNAPVFVVHDKKVRKKVDMLFLLRPEETLLLLRLNLHYLQQVSDDESERLLKSLTGLGHNELRNSRDLCESLIMLKGQSPKHFLKVLAEAPDRKVVLDAADRGEIMKVASQDRVVADDLAEEDIEFLRNVVRARFYTRIGPARKTGEELSELGRKIFGRNKEPFNRFERQALMTLAITVTTDSEQDSDPASSRSGRWLMRRK